MSEEKKVKISSEKKFEGSKPSEFYGEGYFFRAEGSNYGRKTEEGIVFAPYVEETYLLRDRDLAKFLVNKFRPRTILILGCARGYLVKAFREVGVEAWGIDISEWAIQNSPEEVREYLYCGDICDLSVFRDKQIDLIVGLDVFEHIKIPDLYLAISEASRVGKNIVLDVPIGDDDLHPDKSNGTDKSHVSVYTPKWWVQAFAKHDFEASSSNVYTYPEGDRGATITFRPKKPEAPSITIKVAPDSKKFKILWLSNSPTSPSGYGVQTDLYTRWLLRHYEVRIEANYGIEGKAIGLNDLIIYPKLPADDPYAVGAAKLDIAAWKPDVLVTLWDIWPGIFTERQGDALVPIHPRWIPQIPVDHDPIPDQTLMQARAAYKAVAMSKFGCDQLRNNGIEAYYIPHCIKSNVFVPPESKEKKRSDKEWINKHTAPINLQLKTEIRPDDFVIGIVGANIDPQRKSFPRHMLALQLFLEHNPDAKKDVRMSIHSWRDGGRNLPHLANRLHIDSYIKITLTQLMKNGLSTEDMVAMYGGFDLLLNCSEAGGFEIPILEAASCGVPSVATDFTSMNELVKGHGWLVPPVTRYFTSLNSLWAIPNEFKIAEAIEDAYNHPLKREKFGRKAREFSLQYDWEKICPRWAALFEEVRAELGSFGVSESKDQVYAEKVKEILAV